MAEEQGDELLNLDVAALKNHLTSSSTSRRILRLEELSNELPRLGKLSGEKIPSLEAYT